MGGAGGRATWSAGAYERHALESALTGKMLAAPEGSIAVAAVEVVAAALGRPGPGLPPELKAWIERRPPGELAGLAPAARKALARVRDSSVSELHQLWSQGKPNGWTLAVAYLEARLGREALRGEEAAKSVLRHVQLPWMICGGGELNRN